MIKIPLRDKEAYNKYMKEYMRKYKQQIEDRRKQELEAMLDVAQFPINQDNPSECLLFRMVELGLEPRDMHPFLKANHLVKSTKNRKNCPSCHVYCRCWEWDKRGRQRFEGARIW